MNAVLRPDTTRIDYAPMLVEDLESVLAAERRIYGFPWTRGNFEDSLASGYSSWLMREGKQLLGYAVMMRIHDEVHLLNISILPERQHAGLGSGLLRYMCAEARSHGAVRMILEVRQSNGPGREFYGRHGFAQIGERPDYYPAQHGREAALVLEKKI